MTSAAVEVKRIMAGLACLILLLLQVLQVDSRTRPREKRENNCSKLEFELKDPHKCVPCHLCSPHEERRSFHPECRMKNPQPFSHHGGQVLWCDDPSKPLPECPPWPQDIVLNTTARCHQNGREYAPGCECSLSCGDEAELFLRCGPNLTWEETVTGNNARLEKCQATWISSTLPLTTETADGKDASSVVLVAVPVVVLTLVAVVVVSLVAWWRYKRVNYTNDGQSTASSSENSSENGSDYNAQLVPDTHTNIKKDQKMEEARKLLNRRGDNEIEEREVPPPPTGNSSREINNLQTRETPMVAVHMNMSNKEKESEKRSSSNALQALLRDRNQLCKFTKMFDQAYDYGMITWHDVAGKLLGWDRDAVKSSEYLGRPQISACPGDGCMYKIMKEAHHAGMGLLDLLNCLKSFQPFRNKTAETLLEEFWAEWKSKHATQSEGVC